MATAPMAQTDTGILLHRVGFAKIVPRTQKFNRPGSRWSSPALKSEEPFVWIGIGVAHRRNVIKVVVDIVGAEIEGEHQNAEVILNKIKSKASRRERAYSTTEITRRPKRCSNEYRCKDEVGLESDNEGKKSNLKGQPRTVDGGTGKDADYLEP